MSSREYNKSQQQQHTLKHRNRELTVHPPPLPRRRHLCHARTHAHTQGKREKEEKRLASQSTRLRSPPSWILPLYSPLSCCRDSVSVCVCVCTRVLVCLFSPHTHTHKKTQRERRRIGSNQNRTLLSCRVVAGVVACPLFLGFCSFLSPSPRCAIPVLLLLFYLLYCFASLPPSPSPLVLSSCNAFPVCACALACVCVCLCVPRCLSLFGCVGVLCEPCDAQVLQLLLSLFACSSSFFVSVLVSLPPSSPLPLDLTSAQAAFPHPPHSRAALSVSPSHPPLSTSLLSSSSSSRCCSVGSVC